MHNTNKIHQLLEGELALYSSAEGEACEEHSLALTGPVGKWCFNLSSSSRIRTYDPLAMSICLKELRLNNKKQFSFIILQELFHVFSIVAIIQIKEYPAFELRPRKGLQCMSVGLPAPPNPCKIYLYSLAALCLGEELWSSTSLSPYWSKVPNTMTTVTWLNLTVYIIEKWDLTTFSSSPLLSFPSSVSKYFRKFDFLPE